MNRDWKEQYKRAIDGFDGDWAKAHAILHQARRILFIGNGGSAAIASHMAVDFSKHGRVPALAMNDPVSLTCVANDYGYEEVFAQQLQWHSNALDVLVALSSSGCSPNICRAVEIFKPMNMQASVITLSGFDADNPLRKLGNVNFWVDSMDYGIVECTHQAILHSMVQP